MKKQIFKYPINGSNVIQDMPEGAEFLCVQLQGGYPYAWFMVNREAKLVPKALTVYGTGHDIPMNMRYLGTWQEPPLVWHLFDKPHSHVGSTKDE